MMKIFATYNQMKKVTLLSCLLLALSACFVACSDDDDKNIGKAPQPAAEGTWMDERDSVEYKWVRYGQQDWLTTNLSYKPETGATLPDMTPVNPKLYDDGIAKRYFKAFGLLYTHEAALAAVPEGWRLPTDEDWNKLEANSNGDLQGAINLKLGGYYLDDEYFAQLRNVEYYTYIYGFYWSATTDETKTAENFAYYRKLTWNKAGVDRESMQKSNYLSVRLVRDAK